MTMPEFEASGVELSGDSPVDQDRRAFLLKYGKVALVAPPVITTMLATSMSSTAIAQSTGGSGGGGGGGGNGWLFGAGALPLAAIPARQAPALVPLAQPAPPPPPVAPAPVAAPPPPPENYRVGERG